MDTSVVKQAQPTKKRSLLSFEQPLPKRPKKEEAKEQKAEKKQEQEQQHKSNPVMLKHLRENACAELRATGEGSGSNGIGVFATCTIAQGKRPFLMFAEPDVFFLASADVDALGDAKAALVRKFFAYDKQRQGYLVAGDPNKLPLFCYVRESARANLAWSYEHNHFVTVRAVTKDEELTHSAEWSVQQRER